MLFGKSLPIRFVAVHHPGHRGVIPARGALGVNDQGVIHASDTGVVVQDVSPSKYPPGQSALVQDVPPDSLP